MATAVIMPKAGMAMEKGTIVKWLKEEGAVVKQGDILLEITTDKVNMEVEAEVSGTLIKIMAKEGEVLPVFTEIAYIGVAGEAVDPLIGGAAPSVTGTTAVHAQANTQIAARQDGLKKEEDRVRATPAARKAAKGHAVELFQVAGTGPAGRIQKQDVLEFVRHMGEDGPEVRATRLAQKIAVTEGVGLHDLTGTGFGGRITKDDVLDSLKPSVSVAEKAQDVSAHGVRGRLIPLDSMRQVISQRMSESYFSAPTVTLTMEADVTRLKALREELKDGVAKNAGAKLTLTDFLILAVGKTLRKHPFINGTFQSNGLFLYDDVNIALAVGLENGLLVPVLRQVDTMKLTEVAVQSKDLADRAVKMKLLPDEQVGSTFTISNMGMFGITHFTPIINQPNSAILGVGTTVERFMPAEDGSPVLKSIMTLCLTVDHRIIDGTTGAKFLRDVKGFLENPVEILI